MLRYSILSTAKDDVPESFVIESTKIIVVKPEGFIILMLKNE
jgi:hypothetical protein